jgi:hypothetical protein
MKIENKKGLLCHKSYLLSLAIVVSSCGGGKKVLVSNFQQVYDKSSVELALDAAIIKDSENIEECSHEMDRMVAEFAEKFEGLNRLAIDQRENSYEKLISLEAESLSKADFSKKKAAFYGEIEKYGHLVSHLEDETSRLETDYSSKEGESNALANTLAQVQEGASKVRLDIDPIYSATVDKNHGSVGVAGTKSEIECMIESGYNQVGEETRNKGQSIKNSFDAYKRRRSEVYNSFLHDEEDKKGPKGSNIENVVLKNLKAKNERDSGLLGNFSAMLAAHEKGGYDKEGDKLGAGHSLDAIGNISLKVISLATQNHKGAEDVVLGLDKAASSVECMHTYAKSQKDTYKKALDKTPAEKTTDLAAINSERKDDVLKIEDSIQWYSDEYQKNYSEMEAEIQVSDKQYRSTVTTGLANRAQALLKNEYYDYDTPVNSAKMDHDIKSIDGPLMWQILNHKVRQAKELGDEGMIKLTDALAKRITNRKAELLAEENRFNTAMAKADSDAINNINSSPEAKAAKTLKDKKTIKETDKRNKEIRALALPGLIAVKANEITNKSNAITNKQTEITNKEAEIINKETEIKNKETEIEGKKNKIKATEDSILSLASSGKLTPKIKNRIEGNKTNFNNQKTALELEKTNLENEKITLRGEKTILENEKNILAAEKTTIEAQKVVFKEEQTKLPGHIAALNTEIAALNAQLAPTTPVSKALELRETIENGARDKKKNMENSINAKMKKFLEQDIKRLEEAIKLLHQERMSNAKNHGCEIKVGARNLVDIKADYLDNITNNYTPPITDLGSGEVILVPPPVLIEVCCDLANRQALANKGKKEQLALSDYEAQLNFGIRKRDAEMIKYNTWIHELKAEKIKEQTEAQSNLIIKIKYYKQREEPDSKQYGQKGNTHLADYSTEVDEILGIEVGGRELGQNLQYIGMGNDDTMGTLWGENKLVYGSIHNNLASSYVFYPNLQFRPRDEAYKGLPIPA